MTVLLDKKILVIDDSKDVLVLLRKILEGSGCTVFDATSVDEGMRMAVEKSPHLIVTDLNLPQKSGFDFLVQRRESESLNRVPVVVLSGRTDRASVNRAVALGATDYILKPIEAPLVLKKLRKLLRGVEFLSHTFSTNDQPSATASLAVEVLRMNEAGFQIGSPVKLCSEQTIAITGKIFEDAGCLDILKRTALSPLPRLEQGRYVSDVSFVGVNENVAKIIRHLLKRFP